MDARIRRLDVESCAVRLACNRGFLQFGEPVYINDVLTGRDDGLSFYHREPDAPM